MIDCATRAANQTLNIPLTPLYQFTATDGAIFDPPPVGLEQYGSYIILENYDVAGGDTTHTTHRPRGSGLP